MTIEQRQLGQTALRVSIIGYGASPLRDVFCATDPVESIAAVRYAIERGINFFDVSPYYGDTLAETRLGHALAGVRDKILLATKCGRYGRDTFDFSARRISLGVEESLVRLQTDYFDLLQVHDVEFADVDQIVDETVPALQRLQRQGKTRCIGITGYSLKNLVAIASRVPVDIILTYCRHNLMHSDIDDMLVPFATRHEIGLINASPLHMAMLTRSGAPAWHPAQAAVRQAGRQVVELCESRKVDVSELALKFCLQHPIVASTLIGMSTRQQVDASVRALDLVIDPAVMAEVRNIVSPVQGLTWISGLAQNHG